MDGFAAVVEATVVFLDSSAALTAVFWPAELAPAAEDVAAASDDAEAVLAVGLGAVVDAAAVEAPAGFTGFFIDVAPAAAVLAWAVVTGAFGATTGFVVVVVEVVAAAAVASFGWAALVVDIVGALAEAEVAVEVAGLAAYWGFCAVVKFFESMLTLLLIC